MDEQKRLLLAVALMAVVVFVVMRFWPSQGEQQGQTTAPSDGTAAVEEEEEELEIEPEPEPEPGEEAQESPERELHPEKIVTLRSPALVLEISTWGGGVTKAELQHEQFREGSGEETRQLDLVSVDLEERPELTPLAFNIVQKQLSTPDSSQSAEGVGVLRLVNHGNVTAEGLEAAAGLGSKVAKRVVSARPFATLEDLGKTVGGSPEQRRRVMGRLLKAAWQSGMVRLDFEVFSEDEQRVVLRGRTDNDVDVVRAIFFVNDNEIRLEDRLKNQSGRLLNLRERVTTAGHEKEVSSSGWFQRPTGQLSGLCLAGDDMVRSTRRELSGESSGCMGCGGGPVGPQQRSGQVRFVAVDRHFFMTALSASPAWGEATCRLRGAPTGEVQASVEPVMFTEVPTGGQTVYASTAYFGPKRYSLLRDLGPARRLWDAIDYGWFAPLSHILLRALRFFNGWVGNWGFSVILLTFLIKLLLLPITHKSLKSMRVMQAEMAVFKPQLDEINAKYKDQPDVKNQKVMEFYQQAGINPLKGMAGGCLPMFLQMPIWIALYRMISESVELYRAPFIFWLDDLSAQDPYYILPGLLGVAMLGQQLLTPQPVGMDNTQQKMMKWMMPVMFIVIMINMPSGLVLYIFANTLLTIVQQQFINRTIPAGPPVVKKGKESPKAQAGDGSNKTDTSRASRKAKPKRRKRK